ncbi:MAG TPA: phosphoribosylanthranilate isomerase [Dokdonella sp.]
MRTRIKFCGLTRAADVDAAVALGVDAIGFVSTRRSRRFVGPAQARALRRALPPFVAAVALFMDDEPAWVEEVVAGMQPDLLQFHGDEAPDYVASFARPYLKAVPMASVDDAGAYAARYADALGFVLDGHAAGAPGGSGTPFDWTRARRLRRPLVLAGGLDAHNVAQAIALARPYAVDVSSGIELAPGVKDAAKMRAFVAAVRAADAERAAAADP